MFLLCADTRLSGGILDDQADKFYRLGRNFLAMLSGSDVAAAVRICRSWRDKISSASALDIDVLAKLMREGLEEAKQSAIFSSELSLEFVVTGFAGSNAMMLYAQIVGEYTKVFEVPTYMAIGSGGEAAKAMLSHRGYRGNLEKEQALYLVYEAKKFSENSDGVGPKTQMLIHGPLEGLARHMSPQAELCANYVSPGALVHLETLRQKFFIPSIIPEMEKFPPDFFDGPYPFSSSKTS